jgi:hypothetical protein
MGVWASDTQQVTGDTPRRIIHWAQGLKGDLDKLRFIPRVRNSPGTWHLNQEGEVSLSLSL